MSNHFLWLGAWAEQFRAIGRIAAIFEEEKRREQVEANETRRTTPRENPVLAQPDA
jgi:hypothetical protein